MIQENNDSKICPICGRSTHKESEYCIFHASAEEKTEKEFKQALKKYINKIKKEDGDYDFKEFIFIGDINFKRDLNVNIFKNADFREATFKGDVYFNEITFEGDVSFFVAFFKKDTIFLKTIFKESANFGGTTFKEYIAFEKTTFEGHAGFEEVTFDREVYFSNTIFKEEVFFTKVSIKGQFYLGDTDFLSSAHFDYSTYEGEVHMTSVTFRENAFFNKSKFNNTITLNKVNFYEKAYFSRSEFNEIVNFNKIVFEKVPFFDNITFRYRVTFSYVECYIGITFNNTIFMVRSILSIICRSGIISLKNTLLENSILSFDLSPNAMINFEYSQLRNTLIRRYEIEGHILQERLRKYFKASEVYLTLRNNFISLGKLDDSGWALKKQKDTERFGDSFKNYWKTRYLKIRKQEINILKLFRIYIFIFYKWLKSFHFRRYYNSQFWDKTCGYGEFPSRVLFFAGFVILIFAIVFSLKGISNPGDLEVHSKILNELSNGNIQIEGNIKEFHDKVFSGNLKFSINNLNIYERNKNIPRRKFRDCLYFSLVVFSTLGLGDFQPLPEYRILTGLEGIIGAVIIAFYVAVTARKYIR